MTVPNLEPLRIFFQVEVVGWEEASVHLSQVQGILEVEAYRLAYHQVAYSY